MPRKRKKKDPEFVDLAKEKFEEMKKTIWPSTRKELEKAMENAKKMLDKGEKYLKDFSEKSIDGTRKMSLALQREKMFYDLGKTFASTPKTKWIGCKKAERMIKKIRVLNIEIKKIK